MAGSRPRKPVVPMMFPSQLARDGVGATPAPGAQSDDVDGIEISVGSQSDSQAARQFVFRQESVVVGRSSACDLRLDDPERLASSRHAEISLSGDCTHVTDLGSRNGTFLDGERLEPQRAYEVDPESEIAISGSRIRVRALIATGQTEDESTVLAPGAVNPLAEDARQLVGALERVAETFEELAPGEREEALDQALRDALGERASEVYRRIGSLLSRSDV